MTIDLYCPVFNEERIIAHMIGFYYRKFPQINFHIYDNGSTDRTRDIAEDLGCTVYHWDTGGEVRDDLLTEWKNTVWKTSTADWVIIIDCDEFVDLKPEHFDGTVIRYQAYEMIGEGQPISEIVKGVRYPVSDKFCAFKLPDIKETNFGIGAHSCSPIGNVQMCSTLPNMYHMRYLDRQRLIDRYKQVYPRLSTINRDKGWGWHYGKQVEKLEAEYDELLAQSTDIR